MTTPVDRCPECAGPLRWMEFQNTRRGAPWCERCEWNLGVFDPRPYQPKGWLTRRSHRAAFALDAQLFREVTRSRPARAWRTTARRVLMTLAVILFAVDLTLLAGGVALIATGNYVFVLIGLAAVALGLELRPRLGRRPKDALSVSRTVAPALWAEVDRAAARLGAKPMDRIYLTDVFNASAQHVGLRRRRVLSLGLPLWGALSDDGRRALLGHELGHFVNGDPTRSQLGQPAMMTFARLAGFTSPGDRLNLSTRSTYGSLIAISDIVVRYVIEAPLSAFFRLIDYGVSTIVARDRMRAEYLADSFAVEFGGPSGGVELAEALIHADVVRSALRVAARRTNDASGWRTALSDVRLARADRLTAQEQASMRYDASLFASHPPAGLRLRAIRVWSASAGHAAPGSPVPSDPIVSKEMDRVARDLARI